MGVFSKPKARRSADQPGCTQIAQLGPQLFRSAHQQGLHLVSCLGVRAFTAERRVARRARIISTWPSASLGLPVAVPARTARAAASASIGSDLLERY